jgi:CheY-like chemotaxis protein
MNPLNMQKNVTCLLIDDDPDDREFFKTALKELDENYICITFQNGHEAIRMLNAGDETDKPDLIFIDLHMPLIDGRNCLREIKNIDKLKNTPAFLYSTNTDPSLAEEIIKLGGSGIIIKAASIPAITRQLAEIIDGLQPSHLSDDLAPENPENNILAIKVVP